jgi:hypothetical protein
MITTKLFCDGCGKEILDNGKINRGEVGLNTFFDACIVVNGKAIKDGDCTGCGYFDKTECPGAGKKQKSVHVNCNP